MNKKQTIGLCVIAKDEAKNIARCIESVKSIVDEIVVVDTGSADDTAGIARSLGAAVYYVSLGRQLFKCEEFRYGESEKRLAAASGRR